MQKSSFYLLLAILVMCSGCFSNPERFVPENLYGSTIRAYPEKSSSEKEIEEVYSYKFGKNNSFKLYNSENQLLYAGNYSYHIEGPKEAQVVTTFSKNKKLVSYTAIYYFETPTSGRWKGSYYSENLDREQGTFKLITDK